MSDTITIAEVNELCAGQDRDRYVVITTQTGLQLIAEKDGETQDGQLRVKLHTVRKIIANKDAIQ